MNSISPQLNFFIQLSKVEAQTSRAFDSTLNGISYKELVILYYLNEAPDTKLRRIDLADKVGLTASGITRLILPMEKIGLVGRDLDERDARVKYVTLTAAGKTKLKDEVTYANKLAESKYPTDNEDQLKEMNQLLTNIK